MLSGSARIADTATLRIASGAVAHLDFSGIDTVGALYPGWHARDRRHLWFPDVPPPDKSTFFAGTGVIQVGPSNYDTWAIPNTIDRRP